MTEIRSEINSFEENIAREAVERALRLGADAARVTINKSTTDEVGTLNGEIEHVIHCLDRSLTLALFIGGRYGTFSTNRLESSELEKFISGGIDITTMFQEDSCRALPEPEHKEKSALSGNELSLCDNAYPEITQVRRVELARRGMAWGASFPDYKLVSEECAYSNHYFDTLVLDSDGLYARHRETSFEYGADVTIEDSKGNLCSGYWWDASPRLSELKAEGCSARAIARAAAQIGSRKAASGTYRIVVDTECAARLVAPLLNALGGYALQQNNSFLRDSLGRKIFGDNVTIIDRCREAGATGSRLFDSEGVATQERAIIENGVVKMYFLNEYIARKLSCPGTVEDASRPTLLPTAEHLIAGIENGIRISGFNGGNSNSATGDFSYGIEGFMIRNGKIAEPVSEAVMTGNFVTLWNNMLAAGSDSRPCMSRQIPTLVFDKVEISGI